MDEQQMPRDCEDASERPIVAVQASDQETGGLLRVARHAQTKDRLLANRPLVLPSGCRRVVRDSHDLATVLTCRQITSI
jgi:hypothetical protein